MMGIVKKVDAQGFGIIEGADGSKVPFILSDVISHTFSNQDKKWLSLSVKSRTRRLPRTSRCWEDRLTLCDPLKAHQTSETHVAVGNPAQYRLWDQTA